MRTLKYAILGLVNRGPISGYDISKEFNKEFINFWYAKHRQIYSELKKLVDEDLIEYEIVTSGDVLEKKLYSITERGKEDFLNWLNQDEGVESISKDKFRLRMFFSNYFKREDLVKLLESHLKQRKNKLASLKEKINLYNTIPKYGEEKFGDYIILEEAILREENYVKWLNESINRCREESDFTKESKNKYIESQRITKIYGKR